VDLALNLVNRDPLNADWARELAVDRRKLAEVLLAGGRAAAARHEVESARLAFEELLVGEPDHRDWQRELAEVLLVQAACDLEAGAAAAALGAGGRALALVGPPAGDGGADREVRRLSSLAHTRRGEALALLGRGDEAAAAWAQALELIEPLARESRDAGMLEIWVRPLLHLGRRQEAAPVLARLERAGYVPVRPLPGRVVPAGGLR
jgi:tetratricopeptide (TPR) repeat protein